ncbi:MAG TPA: M64 family metallopeptidase, partial [Pyrinomonadaceae bacterium]|nr:M64 family metallopeptidase [Pyrinomonadaceae bacterium]
ALFREELERETKMFAAEKHFGQVGAFEGAMYEPRGYYRPEIDCIMFSRTDKFCRVCRVAIERVIKMYSRQS